MFGDFKTLLKHRGVQVLVFVLAMEIVALILLWRLDVFVNIDLYDFGLRFSYDWAADYWYNNGLLWGLHGGAILLVVLSIWPQHQHSKTPTKVSRWFGFLLPTLGVVYEVLCVVFLTRIDFLVQNRLYDFGLIRNFNWSTSFILISLGALALFIAAIVGLTLVSSRTLWMIKPKKRKKLNNKKR